MHEGVITATLKEQAPDRFVRLRDPLGVSSFGINQIILEPGQRNRIHRHTHQEEVYLVLSGVLTLVVEGESISVGEGEIVRVPPAPRRQLVNRGPGRVSLLALGGMVGHEHVARDAEAFASWEDTEPGTPQSVPIPEDLPASELERA